MKRFTMITIVTMVAILSVVFCGVALQAQTAGQASWLGVWNGTMGGQPSVTLTLAEDHGQLGGTMVLNMILGQPPNAYVGGSNVFLVTHPRLDGNTLSFQVTRTSDAKLLQIAVRSVDNDRLELHCLNCGDGPTATLVKFRP